MDHSTRDWQSKTATVLVTYNRPWHTAQVIQSLRQQAIQNLIILCDAPRSAMDEKSVSEVHALVQAIDWTKPSITYQKVNQGLAKSILQGIRLALESFEAVILLEDDCVPQPFFFDWIYKCLAQYEHSHEVFGISGYSIPFSPETLSNYPYDAYFFPRMGSWGWATWKSRWIQDDRNLARLTLKCIDQGIDLEQGGKDVPNFIGDSLTGKVKDTWTLPWLLNVYLHKGCYIYPTQSHIHNVGLDGTGVHCGRTDKYNTTFATHSPTRFPEKPIFDSKFSQRFLDYQNAPTRFYSTETLRQLAQKTPMKVVHLSTHDHGGAGIAALRLHQGLVSAGVDSIMLVLSKRSTDPRVISIGSIQEAHQRWNEIALSHPNRRADLELFTDALCKIDLRTIPEFREADVINLHWVAGLVDHSRLAEMLNGRPGIWTMHDMNAFTGGCHYNWECRKFEVQCDSCPQLGSNSHNDISFTGQQYKRNGYHQANLISCCPSQWLASEARKSALWKQFPVKVIPYGYPLDIFKPYPQNVIRSELGIAPDRKVVLFGCESLANVRKGFSFLIDAAKIIYNQSIEKPLFCFFGHLPANLQFPGDSLPLGSISDPNILAALYSMADVFVISSLQDNLPNVVPESLACGTPVVGFNIGGIPDMIQHMQTGYLVGSVSSQELANGILWTLNHVNPSMRTRCRHFAESHYALLLQAQQYIHVYQEALDHAQRQSIPLEQGPKVNLGCGNRFHSQWENFDYTPTHPSVKKANLREGIPLPDNYASVVYHSHVLEHFPKSEAYSFIMDCYRILQPGGVIRIAVPDLETIAKLYLENLQKALQNEPESEDHYDWMMLEMYDQTVRNRSGGAMLDWWIAPQIKAEPFIQQRMGNEVQQVLQGIRSGNKPVIQPEPKSAQQIGEFRLSGEVHQWMYDRYSLSRLLKQCGFRNIRTVSSTESSISDFTGYCLDTDEKGITRKPDSLFMEATK